MRSPSSSRSLITPATSSPKPTEPVEAFVLDRFGGLTRAAQAAKGVWVDEGQRYNDELIVYVVATPSVLKDAGKLLEVIDFARQHFRQEAIYCRYLGFAEIL